MKVVIPMSGMSSRFSCSGYQLPKYLIEVDGKTVIKHIVDLYPKNTEFIFIINDKNANDTNIIEVLKNFDISNRKIKIIPSHKLGPVYTVSHVFDWIDDDEQVVVNYCDFSMYWDYNDFENFVNESQCDGCVVCYTGFHPHMLGSDNYAFCKVDKNNKILKIREKQPFTNNKMSEYASTGTYYFKKGKYVKKYFKQMMNENINLSGEYYVSLIYNFLCSDNLNSLVYEVPHMLQWGTPLDLDMYLKWSEYYNKALEGQKKVFIPNCITALPMAGAGSRFSKEGYDVPKPFIQVNGKDMVDQAIRCLPDTESTIFACLRGHKNTAPAGNIVWIDEILPGQACTTERIINTIDSDKSILISACDNGMFYDVDKFIELVNDKTNDIIIWSYRNNYTSYYNPNMYSWLDVDAEGNVQKVYVKNFTGENPLDEYAVVGTMFFRNKKIYIKSLEKLYEKNIRTNGEFYIDNLINESIELGYKVKNFEIDNYICWGTPNDLKIYQYWQTFFDKVNWHTYAYKDEYFTN
jgi:NDP-sugar pyrophosphorylase family protein